MFFAEDDNAGAPTESFSASTLELSASSPAPVRRSRSERVLDVVEYEPSPSIPSIPDDEVLTGLPAYSEESDVLTQLPEPSSQLDLERLKLEQEKTRLRHAFKMKKLSNRHAYKMEKLAVERLRIENDNILLKMQKETLNQPRKESTADLQTD
ncbi:hypothetical protein RvY_06827-2 [Ramazzottius varieornatus]|uniref:Uncharacterized protein n=1 Tax=Ramazzottius varieornatus TaxID=947166 RepID=A0A1D1V571_RAMVA|nr:hypothetical protein RvY_06827-2 [Ramazzottius varieornatus]